MTSINPNRPSSAGSVTSADSETAADSGTAAASDSGASGSVSAASADGFETAAAASADAPASPLRGYRWSDKVVSSVAEAYGLDDVSALLRTAVALDNGNHYLKRSELEAAAEQLNAGEVKGYRWSPTVLARIMTDSGIDSEAALLREAVKHDDGNRYLKRSELEAAAKVLNGSAVEIGVISDLDKTVIPPERDGNLPDLAYPGVAALFHELEFGGGGQAGDTYYVTARTPDRVGEIPDWLDDKGMPAGPIDTGVSTLPWVAEPEKVADITRIMDANPDQSFILFGDTSHRDPEVFKKVLELRPDQVKAAFVHKVRNARADRVAGMFVHESYADVASELFRLGVVDERQARRVMVSAQMGGLDISDAQIEDLIARNQPD